MDFESGVISGVGRCLIHEAKWILMCNAGSRFQRGGRAELGAAKLPESDGSGAGGGNVWFWALVSTAPGPQALLSLYACVEGRSLSSGLRISLPVKPDMLDSVKTHIPYTSNTFSTTSIPYASQNQYYYLQTYCFNRDQIVALDKKNLCIPIRISMGIENTYKLEKDFCEQVKVQYGTSKVPRDLSDPDLTLETNDGHKIQVHKVVLAAHSALLRNQIHPDTKNLKLDSLGKCQLEMLLNFLYSGSVSELSSAEYTELKTIGQRYQVHSLDA